MTTDTLHNGCPVCGRTDVQLKKDGTLRHHAGPTNTPTHDGRRAYRCGGAGKAPKTH